ncbi:MAG: AbrB family transcriptional regulator, partial [Alphaproteobacteria bacterium]
AWMIGAMVATAASAVSGVRVVMDSRLRMVMVVVLGAMLGSAFSPEILERAVRWPITLASLMLYVAVAGGLTFILYRRTTGLDRPTAYFAGMPGGFNEMVIMGAALGGNERTVSLAHSTRVFLVVMIIPFWFRFVEDYSPAARAAAALGLGEVAVSDLAILSVSAAAGIAAARLLRLPAYHLTGAMGGSAVAHLAGWTSAPPPWELVAIAQVVVGATIGSRFSGVSLRVMFRTIGSAALMTLVLLILATIFAAVLTRVSGFSFPPLLLAFSPGGLAEMSLVALALDVDTAFVATHHVARIAAVVMLAPLVFRLVQARARNKPGNT